MCCTFLFEVTFMVLPALAKASSLIFCDVFSVIVCVGHSAQFNFAFPPVCVFTSEFYDIYLILYTHTYTHSAVAETGRRSLRFKGKGQPFLK